MAIEFDASEAIREAEEILAESDTRGFAWAPWVDVRRYGVLNGLVKPILTHLSPISMPPPITYDAPQAGREDFRSLRRNQPHQK